MNLLPIDDLEILRAKLEARSELDADDVIDEVLDILIVAYMNGNLDANESLGTSVEPSTSKFEKTAYKEYDGKDFMDRVREYVEAKDIDGVMLVADTESHRLYNTGVYDTAKDSSLTVYKRWNTMQDEKVRDQHVYLEGQRVPLEAEFYTYTGDHAKAPGMFQDAENNCNCRCTISVEKE